MDENPDKIHIRHVMLFYFRKGSKVMKTTREIHSVYGENSVSERTVRKWFQRFRAGQFNLEDQERCGRPPSTDIERLKTLLYENPRYTLRELGQILGLSKSTVWQHLLKQGYTNRHDVWVPKNLTKKNMSERLSICKMLIKQFETNNFLDRLVVVGETFISFDNISRKKFCSYPRRPVTGSEDGQDNAPVINRKKVLLSICWDHKGLINYELNEDTLQLSVERYCQQLDQIKIKLEQKRPELLLPNDLDDGQTCRIMYLHDNTKPHVSKETEEKLKNLSWNVLPHPPYSPDLSPCDYHLFRSLQETLIDKTFDSIDEIKWHLDRFIDQRSKKFWHEGIFQLPDRWTKVIKKNGAYFKDDNRLSSNTPTPVEIPLQVIIKKEEINEPEINFC